MAKTPKFKVETCASKFVLRNMVKPDGYLRPDGKLTPFMDGNTLMLDDKETADIMAAALNRNPQAVIISMITAMIQTDTADYKSVLTAAGLNMGDEDGK